MRAKPAAWWRGALAVAIALAVVAPQMASARTGHGFGRAIGRQAHHAHKKNCPIGSCLASHLQGAPKSLSVTQ